MFDDNCLALLAPLLGAAVNVAIHLLACRWSGIRGAYSRLLCGFFAGLPVVLVVSLIAARAGEKSALDCTALCVFNILTYFGLAFGYFAFVNLNIASLRIRMLQELLEAGGSLPKNKLAACFNTDEVIRLRIERLLRGGHLVETNGRIYTGRRYFLLLGRVIDFMRRMILGGKALPAASPTMAVREQNPAGKP